MKNFGLIATALASIAALWVAGCDSENNKTYDIPISWNIAGAETCVFNLDADTVLEFDAVTIDIYDREGDEQPIQDRIEVACSDFGYTITRLERGTYFLELGAWAVDEDGEYLPYFQASDEVRAPAEEENGYQFGLMLGTGDIEIKWGFANYEWCDGNGVVDMDISLVDELVPCTDEMYLLEDQTPGGYTLTIEGLDADGVPVSYGEYNEGDPFSLKPGQLVDALVVLDDYSN